VRCGVPPSERANAIAWLSSSPTRSRRAALSLEQLVSFIVDAKALTDIRDGGTIMKNTRGGLQ
jgi:hypothetical protein